MILQSLFGRSVGFNDDFEKNVLGGIYKNFTCKRKDVHAITNETNELFVPPVACSYSKAHSHMLALADEDGGVSIINTNMPSMQSLKEWPAHSNAIFDVDWSPSDHIDAFSNGCRDQKLLTASGDQSIVMWDVETEGKLATFLGHSSSVKTAKFSCHSADILVSGSRDGHIMVWDQRVRANNGILKPVSSILNAHVAIKNVRNNKNKQQSLHHSVTAVLFQDDVTFASAGCADGSIKFWDLRKLKGSKPKQSFACQSRYGRSYGISSLVFDQSKTLLFASCLDHSIYQYDTLNYNPQPVTCYRGHKVGSFFIKLSMSPDDRFILSGSSDHHAYLWSVEHPNYPSYEPPLRRSSLSSQKSENRAAIKLIGHKAEVTSVAWCQSDALRLVTLSDDNEAWVWRVGVEEEERDYYDEVLGRTQICSFKTFSTPRKCFFSSTPKKCTVVNTNTTTSHTPFLTNLPSRKTITSYFSSSKLPSPKKIVISPRKFSLPVNISLQTKSNTDNKDSGKNIVTNGKKASKSSLVDGGSGGKKEGGRVKRRLCDDSSDDSLLCSPLQDAPSVDHNNNLPQLKRFKPASSPNNSISSHIINKSPFGSLSSPSSKMKQTPLLKKIKTELESQSPTTNFKSPTADLPDRRFEEFLKKKRMTRQSCGGVENDSSSPRTPKGLLNSPKNMKLHVLKKEEKVKNDSKNIVATKPLNSYAACNVLTPNRHNWLTQLSNKKNLTNTPKNTKPSSANKSSKKKKTGDKNNSKKGLENYWESKQGS